jgi:hypothetical protein
LFSFAIKNQKYFKAELRNSKKLLHLSYASNPKFVMRKENTGDTEIFEDVYKEYTTKRKKDYI